MSPKWIQLLTTCFPDLPWCLTWLVRLQCPLSSLLFLLLIPLPSVAIVGLCQQMKKRKNYKKTPGLLSLPLAQFLTDVSQLHSKSITETFAEIMIKTLASCHFDLIRDISASLFSLLSVIKASHNWMICLCSNSWHHLLPKSQGVSKNSRSNFRSQQHLHLCCSSLYQRHLANEASRTALCIKLLSWNLSMFPRVNTETLQSWLVCCTGLI